MINYIDIYTEYIRDEVEDCYLSCHDFDLSSLQHIYDYINIIRKTSGLEPLKSEILGIKPNSKY